MGQDLHLYLVDWEEFHHRFSVDLVEAQKETETSDGIFFESFWNDNAYEGEELSYHLLGTLQSIRDRLLKGDAPTHTENLDHLNWWQKFWHVPPPPIKILHPGTPEFEFCQQWLQDFEFAFSRLEPIYFSEYSLRHDSPIDFSPLKDVTIGTLSPETVKQVAARFPALEILDYPNCRTIIDDVDNSAWAWEHAFLVLHPFINKARDEGKGLCIFMI
jgi:hypothetical protein